MLDNLTVRNKFLVASAIPAACFVAIAVLAVAGADPPLIAGVAIAAIVVTFVVAHRLGDRTRRRISSIVGQLDDLDLDATPSAANGESTSDEIDDDDSPAADEIGAVMRSAKGLTQRVATSQASHRQATASRAQALLDGAAADSLALLGLQLDEIDWLEAREDDAERLERLFRLDHLTARLHRSAARLLVLAGHDSIHTRTRPAPIIDVIRVAMGEMADFGAIELRTVDEVMIAPSAACELAQLLSELLANSLGNSPEGTPVEVHATHLDDESYRITIIDHGRGTDAAQLAAAQASVHSPSGIDDLPDHRIGLAVVARLAKHLGAGIDFSATSGSGVTVTVRLPAILIVGEGTVRPLIRQRRKTDSGQDTAGDDSVSIPSMPELEHAIREVHESAPGSTRDDEWSPPAMPPRASEMPAAAQAPAIESPPERASAIHRRTEQTPTEPGPARHGTTVEAAPSWVAPSLPPRADATTAEPPTPLRRNDDQPVASPSHERQAGEEPAVLVRRTRGASKAPPASTGPPVRVSSRSARETRSMITAYRKGLHQGRAEDATDDE